MMMGGREEEEEEEEEENVGWCCSGESAAHLSVMIKFSLVLIIWV